MPAFVVPWMDVTAIGAIRIWKAKNKKPERMLTLMGQG
jgi:hypothetical protein